MRTELIVGESAFTELAAEWDELAGRGMTDTPFQTLAYQKSWWAHLKPEGSTLVTIATRSDSGELLGLGCFFNLNGSLHFNGCVEETDYLDLICLPEQAESVWRATVSCLLSMNAPAWSTMDLCNVPEVSPTRIILHTLAGELALQWEENVQEVCPIIQLPTSFDAYLESLESKQRRELVRKLRRAEGSDVITTIVNPEDDIRYEVESFLDLLQKSTFEKRDWLNEGRRAVFHDVAQAAHESGTLQLVFTAVEDRRAAALFNFDYKDRIWVYNSGLDPAAFASLSPGVVLTAKSIEFAIAQGCKEFDFLRGDEEYKYRFGAVDTNIYRIRLYRVTAGTD